MNDNTKDERAIARLVVEMIDAISQRDKATQTVEDVAFQWMDKNLIDLPVTTALEFMTAVALTALEMAEKKEGLE
jgi:hypothetical protein